MSGRLPTGQREGSARRYYGQLLAARRRHLGFTLDSLARKIGISSSWVTEVEAGAVLHSQKLADKWYTALGLFGSLRTPVERAYEQARIEQDNA